MQVVSAVSAGAGYRFAFEGAAKRVDFVASNYLVTKSLAAGVLGSGLVYFGKGESATAAGYALLGIAGDAGAGKVQNLIVTSGEEKMDGLARLQRAKSNLMPKRSIAGRAMMRARQEPRALPFSAARAEKMAMRQNRSMPDPSGVDYGGLVFSDLIYNV